MTDKSPNVGRTLQKAVRNARLPLAEKSLLRELAASFHAPSNGTSIGKARAMLYAGLPDEAAFYAARTRLKELGLLDWVNPPPLDGKPQAPLYTFNLAAIEAAGGSANPKAMEGST